MSLKKISHSIFLLFFLALIITLGGGFFLFQRHLNTPLSLSKPHTLSIKRGDTLKQTLDKLEREQILQHTRLLYLYARWLKRTSIRTGEYLIEPQDTPKIMLDKLITGKVRTEQFTIVEGQNRWIIRNSLAAAAWMTVTEFDHLCDDQNFLKQNDIPGPTCEGYLFPETYTIARGLSAKAIFKVMFQMFHNVYREITHVGTGPLQFTPRQLVTLASIVEKETGAPEERPRIACVFYNRLKAKPAWRLETDPTSIYAATIADPNFNGNLKRKHLRDFKHPYNTYHIYGLPPGPIANPGKAALKAVVAPSNCNDFFFVSMNNGRHFFCPTLSCHNKAVAAWQLHNRGMR
ncbi:MAG: endolytic transglycosylase MltG [Deltaproteobacteria bacterium]|nr:endolytic transglycosylase MltG [Deltaproteobacteria bacterium]